MAKTIVVSVGEDMTNRGKFYWDIKTAALEKLLVRKGFKTLEDAKKDLEEFRRDLDETLDKGMVLVDH
jgi:hypothetical protein